MVPEIASKLDGMELATCFSQNKDELILGFCKKDSEFYIRVTLESNLSCLSFPKDFHRAGKNSADLFQELIGQRVIGVTQHQNERSFHISFENQMTLLVQLFGNRGNVHLIQKSVVVHSFKSNLQPPEGEKLFDFDRHLDLTVQAFERQEGDIKKVFPTFGRTVNAELESRGYSQKDLMGKWQLVSELLEEFESNEFHLIRKDEIPALVCFKAENKVKSYETAIDAANGFFHEFKYNYAQGQLKKELEAHFQSSIKKAESYLSKTKNRLRQIETRASNRLVGDIIMANLYNIPDGAKTVKLNDFYSGNDISIKLNPKLSPQENAENYYRKAKNERIEIDQINKNISEVEKQLKDFQSGYARMLEIDEYKELKAFAKDISIGNKSSSSKPEQQKFKEFEIDGFQIYVGRNAKNNDELTLKFAKKDDTWLHAKDVSGSHVVIKQIPGKNIPDSVLERAASIAAYYSKRKNETYCPVIITQKKFVRKRKGAPAGQVMVEQEKVRIVPPGLP